MITRLRRREGRRERRRQRVRSRRMRRRIRGRGFTVRPWSCRMWEGGGHSRYPLDDNCAGELGIIHS